MHYNPKKTGKSIFRIKTLFSLALLMQSVSLCAGTVRMFNDSPYKLRAVIRASDGTFLAEYVVNSQTSSSWSDTWDGYSAPTNPERSQTPYTVLWYCLDGSAFSVFSNLATGGTATAMSGDGAKQCRGKNIEPQQPQQGAQPAPALPPLPSQGNAQSSSPSQTTPPYPMPQDEYDNPNYSPPDTSSY